MASLLKVGRAGSPGRKVVPVRKAYNLSPKLGCISELKGALISNYAGTIGVNQDSPQLTRCLRGPIVGHSDESKAYRWPLPH